MKATSRTVLFATALLACLTIAATGYTATNGVIAYPCRDNFGFQNICYINADGSGKVQMTFVRNGGAGLPAWSPDGQTLAYVKVDFRINIPTIVTMSKDGRHVRTLGYGVMPSWSPDGNWIVFAWPGSAGNLEIWRMRPNGHGRRQLTNNGVDSAFPSYSSDGNSIIYVQVDPQQHSSIWGMTANGGDQHQITTDSSWFNYDEDGNIINTANDANSSNASPVDQQIVFWAGVEGGLGQIWTMNSDGSNRMQLTFVPDSSNDDPVWSADGQQILFSTNRSGPIEMWVMNANGSDPHKVADNTLGPLPADAAWQPLP